MPDAPAPPSIPAEPLPSLEVDSTVSQVQVVMRRLVHGSALYALANFGIRAMNFLLIPLYTRYLAPADYGTISLAETCAAVLAAFCSLGLDAGVQRFYFQYVAEPPRLARYLGTVLRFGMAFAAALVAAVFLAGPGLLHRLAPQFAVPFYPYIALAVGTAALVQVVQTRLNLYQTEGRPRAYGLLSLALFLMTAAGAVALVVFLRRGAEGMLEGKLLAAAAAAAVALALLWRWLFTGWEWGFVRETLRMSLPLVPHNLMALGLVVADRFILQRYRDLTEVGIYSLTYTFGMVMFLASNSIFQAWSPIFYDMARQGEEGRRILGRLSSGLAILLAGIAAVGILISHDVVRVLDVRYAAVGGLVPWIIAGYLLHGCFGLFQVAVLQSRRSEFVMFTSLLAFAANIGLNLWLIPLRGAYGAAYATLAAYALEALVMYLYAQKVFALPWRSARLLAALGVVGAALVAAEASWPASYRPVAMAVTLLVALPLLWQLGGREIREDLRLIWKDRAARQS